MRTKASKETLESVAWQLQKEILDRLTNGENVTAKQEETLLECTLARIYGKIGSRLGAKLRRGHVIRSEGTRILVEGYLARVERTWALESLLNNSGGINEKLTHNLLMRILSEDAAKSQHATLHKVAPDWVEAPASKATGAVKQPRKSTTRSQEEINEILTGTTLEGSILEIESKDVPQNFIRLNTLELLGVGKDDLSNSLRAVFIEHGVQPIFIRKGYYREDVLRLASLKLREASRLNLQNAIDQVCGLILEAEIVVS